MQSRKRMVYVAGPITKGVLRDNIARAHAAGLALLKAGISPIVPHGSCFWGSLCEGAAFVPEALPAGTAHADWVGMDLEIVRRCDAVLRLPGESVGADAEEACARGCGLPVFRSVADCLAWARGEAATA